MTFWQQFFQLAETAVEVSPLVVPLVLLLLVVALGGQLWLGTLTDIGGWSWGLLFAQALVAPTVLVPGVIGACEDCLPTAPAEGASHPWARTMADVFVLGQLLAALFVVVKRPGQRGGAVALQAVLFWLSLSASFAAAMSISGVWL